MQKEQSSNSTPKTKSALLDKYEKQNEEAHQKEVDGYERLKKKESDKLPQPTGWRMLVLPFKMPERTKGGLYLGQETLERQQVASTCGLVLQHKVHIVMIRKNFLKDHGAKKEIGLSLQDMQVAEYKSMVGK